MNDGKPEFLIVDLELAGELGKDAAWLVALLEFKAIWWANKDGWFHMAHWKIEDMIQLSPYKQREATRRLVEAGVIESKVEGMPNTTRYRIGNYSRPTGSPQDPDSPVVKNLTTVVKKLPTKKEVKKEVSCSGEQPGRAAARPGDGSEPSNGKNKFPWPAPRRRSPQSTLNETDPDVPASRKGAKRIAKRKNVSAKKTKDDLLNEVPENVRPVFNRWLEVGVQHKPGTLVFTESIQAIKAVKGGTYFNEKPLDPTDVRPYTDDEIINAIDRFDLKRNNPDYHGSQKYLRGLSLPHFFYNEYPSNPSKSVFLECLHSHPQRKDDHDPKFTAYVAEMYSKSTGNRLPIEQIIGVGAKMDKFFKGHAEELKKHKVRTREKLVRVWMAWLETKFDKVSIRLLLSKKLDSAFLEYMKE